jgi:hypothetical protein
MRSVGYRYHAHEHKTSTHETSTAEEEYEDLIMRMATTEAEKIDLDAKKLSARRKLQRAQAFAEKWMTIPKTPMPSLWHAKTDYQAIGKPPKSPYDEVSSIGLLSRMGS